MSDLEDYLNRIRLIRLAESVTYEKIAQMAGLKYSRLQNVLNEYAELRVSDLVGIAKVFPEYEVWLFTGREYPEDGQISPITKMNNK